MALFSRRALQRMLDENARWMLPRQVQRHVDTLNNPASDQTIPFEWEIAVVNGLYKLGQLTFEPMLGSSKPDVLFVAKPSAPPVIADITTVSDKGLHAQNPFEPLIEELNPYLQELRANGVRGGFDIKVGDNANPKKLGRQKISLKLPPPRRFKEEIFSSKFREFINNILAGRHLRHEYLLRMPDVDVQITYQPEGQFLSSTHAQYRLAYSETENRVYGAMHEKAVQLKNTGCSGPFGVILCDGDCDLITRPSGQWAGAYYGIPDVVARFLQEHPFISFVLVLTISHNPPASNALNIDPRTLSHASSIYPSAPIVHASTLEALTRLTDVLPRPIQTAQNARYHLEWARRTGRWNQGSTLFGGLELTHKTIKISARAVQEFLAGELTQQAFLTAYSENGSTPFRRMLQQGRLITGVNVEKSDLVEDDDDWLVFEFGEPDPAVMPFINRLSKKKPKDGAPARK